LSRVALGTIRATSEGSGMSGIVVVGSLNVDLTVEVGRLPAPR
jgi:hypothetical protein